MWRMWKSDWSRNIELYVTDKAYDVYRWVCRRAAKYYVVDGCSSHRFQQTYLEQHFMTMLKGLHGNEDFQKEIEAIISNTELSVQELKQEAETQIRMEQLNQELYEVVDEELHQDGQDSQRVDELSGGIVKLHQQLKAFSDRKKLAEQYQNEFNVLMKKVKLLQRKIKALLIALFYLFQL